jgi:protoheme IX farnesyltransferase
MIGWACATGGVALESLAMFALIFLWTPPHFWALALFMKSDYDDAGVPMLTVTHGRRATRRQILGYSLVLAPVAVATTLTAIGGPLSAAAAVVLNVLFVAGAVRIARRDEPAAEADGYAVEKRFFRYSLAYLFLMFGAFLAEAMLRTVGAGGW